MIKVIVSLVNIECSLYNNTDISELLEDFLIDLPSTCSKKHKSSFGIMIGFENIHHCQLLQSYLSWPFLDAEMGMLNECW